MIKEINNFIRKITQNHLNTRYLFTPIAIAYYKFEDDVIIKMIFCFGIRIYRSGLLK